MVELLKAYEKQEKQIRANKAGVSDALFFSEALTLNYFLRFDRSFVSFNDKHKNRVDYN